MALGEPSGVQVGPGVLRLRDLGEAHQRNSLERIQMFHLPTLDFNGRLTLETRETGASNVKNRFDVSLQRRRPVQRSDCTCFPQSAQVPCPSPHSKTAHSYVLMSNNSSLVGIDLYLGIHQNSLQKGFTFFALPVD